MNVPVPDTSVPEKERIRAEREAQRTGVSTTSSSQVANTSISFEDSLFSRAGFVGGNDPKSAPSNSQNQGFDVESKDNTVPIEDLVPNRPPMELFKSIFEDSSSDSESEEENEDDKIEKPIVKATDSRVVVKAIPKATMDTSQAEQSLPSRIIFSKTNTSNV